MILHVDMDAFYASVEQRDRPELRGQPVIVGGTADGRGVVSAASYEARRYGVHSAMPSSTAFRLCPKAIVLPPRIGYYSQVSHQIREILESFTPVIEPLSLDEAFLDVNGTEPLHGSPLEIARRIKSRIQSELGLVASVGVAPNKFLAKIASDLQKPDALVLVEPSRVQEFLDPLPVSRLWGVGKVTAKTFERMAISTIGQLRNLPLDAARSLFGHSGEHFWRLAHGLDDRPVVPDRDAKSISNESTFAEDIDDAEVLREWLVSQVEQVARRLRGHGLRARTIEIKLRLSDFQTLTRSRTLPEATDITSELLSEALELFEKFPSRSLPIRLLGFGVSGLDQGKLSQLTLFEEPAREKQRKLDEIADQIAVKFGKQALHRGAGIDPTKRD